VAPELGRKWGKGAANLEFERFSGDKTAILAAIVNDLPV
jgi:hypothetical protein